MRDRSRDDVDLVTGATGFVGAALVLELLRRGSGSIVALVRPGAEAASDRLRRALREAAVAYDAEPEIFEAIERRCVAVAGDISLPGCGVDSLPSGSYARLWHSAASLRFEDRYAAEIRAVNVDGTRNALDLAARAGARCFNYVSTAYVAGAREGLVSAAKVAEPRPNNLYEASKIEAEAAVEAERRFAVQVLRPSIVIGHSQTLGATTFSGMYGFLRRLYTFCRIMDRTERGLLAARPLRICGDPAAALDLVPIDQVAAEAAGIGLAERSGAGECAYFHLNQARPPTVGAVLGAMAEALMIAPPRWVDGAREFEWIDEKFNERIDFYRSYLRGQKRFDRAATDALVGAPAGSMTIDAAALDRHVAWYLQRIEGERAGIPGSR